ncbi:MAG: hypothetical protein WCL30_02955, partial [Pseudomonadota bacterium]
MSKSVVALATTTALVIGGYTAFWFKESEIFKQQAINNIEKINQAQKNLNKDVVAIKYDSIEASGYPFEMKLNIIKPVITLDAAAAIKSFKQMQKKGGSIDASQDAKPISWIVEIAYGDAVSLTGNLFMNKFSLASSGENTIKSTLNGQLRSVVLSSSPNAICNLSIAPKEGNLPWQIPAVFNDGKAFLNAFKS